MKTRKGLFTYTKDNGDIVFRLYETDILTKTKEGFILNSGGYRTNHTKNCINDNLPVGYRVFQKNYEWYIETPELTVVFEDKYLLKIEA